jgi:hypothetical protein
MRGQGRQLTRIVAAASLGPDEPGLEWDASQQSNIEHHLVFLVEDCEGLVFVNPGVAFPDDGNHPRRGMYFVNSRNCSVLGGGGANFRQQGGAAGDDYTIEIDADSYGIRIDGLRIPSSNAIDAVKDVGAASSIRIFSNALQEFEEAGLRRVAVGPALPPGDLGPVVALREVFDENGNRLGVLPIYELAEP